ncbi:peptidoglycan D,D-transpeptidase FtsI family protein [Thalassiella azotivora]
MAATATSARPAGQRRDRRPGQGSGAGTRGELRPPQPARRSGRPPGSAGRLASPDRRLRVAATGVLVVLSLFVGRLVQLQALDAEALAADALGRRMVETTLQAPRGDVTDANGVVLATSVERRTVTVDQTLVPLYEKEVAGTTQVVGVEGAAADLAPLLGADLDDVRAALGAGVAEQDLKRYAVVARDVTPQAWRRIQDLRVPGLLSETTSERVYPAGAVGGNLLGFVGADGEPLAGLEMTHDGVLSGQDGMRRYEKGRQGQMIPTGDRAEVAPTAGSDLVLTIDRDLQWYAQQRVARAVEESGAEWGTVTVVDPETGDVKAIAEAPSVDPNDPGASEPEDRGSRALSGVIEPGSTAKVVTAAAVIEEGLYDPTTPMTVPDRYTTSNGQTFKDSHSHPVLPLTFAGVLAQSSNTGTVMAGERLTRDQRYDYLTRFGIGQPTGLDFPGETRGILAEPGDWDGRQQYTVLFGQGLSTNALQSAQVFSTIANDGVRVTPRLVAGTRSPDGTFTAEPTAGSTQVVSPETASQVRVMLEAAVAEGTGDNAAIPGYRVAGKTGTAQAPGNGRYEGYTSSFIGMAPAEDPKLVVSVTLQRPTNGFYGGTVAAPVFRDVMSYALQTFRIPPSGEPAELYPLTHGG